MTGAVWAPSDEAAADGTLDEAELRLLEEIAMLDQMSDGRFDIGVGPGVSPFEVGYYGVGQDKQAIYRETLDVLVKGLTSERLNHQGTHHQFANVPMILRTLQKPMPESPRTLPRPNSQMPVRETGKHITG